ncbi:MAG: pyruvate kinase [Anaerolineae bacterium]|nr:pyruvate kinase [Anaerolineae bacterium]
MPRTKIVATIGPASEGEDRLRALIQAGLNVARLNMSHGTHDDHGRRLAAIRRVADELGVQVAVLADLQGPKLRIGALEGGSADLVPGQPFTLTTEPVVGNASLATAPYPELPHDARSGNRILLADGNLELQVTGTTPTTVETVVVHGGTLRSHQGVNLPGVATSLQSLTERDRADLAWAIENGVDYVALSFVRHPRDIQELRYALLQHGVRIPIVAKIEKVEAVENIDAIIAATDAVMVARGDLGVEMPAERVPITQKLIIKKARLAARPVITATQMLESMIQNPRPTRAEASDVANAILDGTDAVMLSAETAIGQFPVEAVRMMTRIAEVTEKTLDWRGHIREALDIKAASITEAISQAVVEITYELDCRAILAATASGTTAIGVARWRPETPIIGVTSSLEVARRLALVWGVKPLVIRSCHTTEDLFQAAMEGARAAGHLDTGDTVVMTAGLPIGVPGQTNSLRVETVGEKR